MYGLPLINAAPPVGRVSPSSMRSVVVLPEPLRPRKPVTRPGQAVKEMPSTARTLPYALVSSTVSIIAGHYPTWTSAAAASAAAARAARRRRIGQLTAPPSTSTPPRVLQMYGAEL